MGIVVTGVAAAAVLDSRGRPTVEVRLADATGSTVEAMVSAGASKVSGEATERRDAVPARDRGEGVLQVAETIEGEIAQEIVGRSWSSLEDLDGALCSLDGTTQKERLGANAIIGVSMAAARLFARVGGAPLWKWLPHPSPARLPLPYFNVVNGGAHAGNRLDFQELMVVPAGAPTFAEAVRAGAEVYRSLREELESLGLGAALGDEDGFAPELQAPQDGLDLLVAAIGRAGYELVGDDNVATSPARIRRAIASGHGTGALIELDQIGTVSETIEAVRFCVEGGFGAMVSHRSGDTIDTFIADLAVATGCGQLKAGAPARGDRVAAYNRISAIERDDPTLAFGRPWR